MCGIAGIVSHNPDFISKEKLKATSAALIHRGPESHGFWINDSNTVAFAHRRLSIIDLTEAAAQPLFYNNRYSIIYNGEIYNYLELRSSLIKEEFQFKSASDTEIIIAAYAAWGEACLQQFDGMFAFAIWDMQEQKLFAARDRFGEKPFYFFYDGERFAFASEMKGLWELGIQKDVNRSMLYNFLSIGYTSNPADPQETFYNHISKLPAASYLTYSLPGNQLEIKKYWQAYVNVNENISGQEAIEQFTILFSDSIRKRLRSDVAIGTSLSGGLDSSAVVAFCDKQMADNYTHKCFTVTYPGFEKDEFAYASAVAKSYRLQHCTTTIIEDEVAELMKMVMHHQEEPFSSASPLGQYKVFQLAKENGVTVLLDGQGADEILAGYFKYYKWYWQELYRNKQLNSSAELKYARSLGVTEPFNIKNKLAALLPEFSAGILQTKKAKEAFQHAHLNRDFAFENKRNLNYTVPASHDLNGALYHDTFINGLEELLRLADRNSMAHSTEVRLPFLNYQLVEFLFTLPPHFKIHEGWTKWLLRKSVDDKLPKEITWRKNKVGFEPPQKKWMINKAVQESIMEGKKKLVQAHILDPITLKNLRPHNAYAAVNSDWKYWSASFLF